MNLQILHLQAPGSVKCFPMSKCHGSEEDQLVERINWVDFPGKTNQHPLKINGWSRCISYEHRVILGDMLVIELVVFHQPIPKNMRTSK